MSNVFIYANNINTTLASPASSGATSLTLASSANLPVIGAGQTLVITLNDVATRSIFEVIYVAGPISGATLTNCARGQEGTTPQNWLASDLAYSDVTAGILANLQQTTVPVVGNPLQFVNIHADSQSNFSSFTKIDTTGFSIPAGALAVGTRLQINVQGVINVTGTPTVQFKIEVGGQSLGSAPGTAQAIAIPVMGFQLKYTGIVTAAGSGGSVQVLEGWISFQFGSTVVALVGVGGGFSINTTIANIVDIYAAFSAANPSNSVGLDAWTVAIDYAPPANIIT